MKLVKIAEYDNESERLTYPEAVKAAKKKGAELLTVEEWIDCGIQYGHPLYCCTPSWLKKTKDGLLARGVNGILGYRRNVDAGILPSLRFGVVGKLIEKKKVKA